MKPANIQGSRPCVTRVRRLCIPCVIQPASTHFSRRVLSFSQPQMFETSTSPQEFQRPQNPVMRTSCVKTLIRDLFITGSCEVFRQFPKRAQQTLFKTCVACSPPLNCSDVVSPQNPAVRNCTRCPGVIFHVSSMSSLVHDSPELTCMHEARSFKKLFCLLQSMARAAF